MLFILRSVVYRSFPTSNHNSATSFNTDAALYIVRFLHQTTTSYCTLPTDFLLYIVRFLHQTTTVITSNPNLELLYIVRFLHQTTTIVIYLLFNECCISFVSYIKPQLPTVAEFQSDCCISFVSYIKPQRAATRKRGELVVYRSFPTSNHNYLQRRAPPTRLYIVRFLHQTTTAINHRAFAEKLYIVRFLHQTTTCPPFFLLLLCCISFVSYIKPQPDTLQLIRALRCISFVSYIKPQPFLSRACNINSCISFVSYIKPQLEREDDMLKQVVYRSFPTSNCIALN